MQPWGTVWWRAHWYLVGFDTDRDDVRVFRASRIDGSVRTDPDGQPYEVPEGFDAADAIGRFARSDAVMLDLALAPGVAAALRLNAEPRGQDDARGRPGLACPSRSCLGDLLRSRLRDRGPSPGPARGRRRGRRAARGPAGCPVHARAQGRARTHGRCPARWSGHGAVRPPACPRPVAGGQQRGQGRRRRRPLRDHRGATAGRPRVGHHLGGRRLDAVRHPVLGGRRRDRGHRRPRPRRAADADPGRGPGPDRGAQRPGHRPRGCRQRRARLRDRQAGRGPRAARPGPGRPRGACGPARGRCRSGRAGAGRRAGRRADLPRRRA